MLDALSEDMEAAWTTGLQGLLISQTCAKDAEHAPEMAIGISDTAPAYCPPTGAAQSSGASTSFEQHDR